MKKHINIPVFIPHLGCPNMCVFCNQRYISGVEEFKPERAREVIDGIVSATKDEDVEREIAFFGGSFGAITGMRFFNHKTRKKKFKYLVFLFLVLQTVGLLILTMGL